MDAKNSNQDAVVAVIENKLDQLINAVQEIKKEMHDNSVDIADLKVKITKYEVENSNQQKEIDQINKRNETFKGWLMGITASLILSIAATSAKLLLGL